MPSSLLTRSDQAQLDEGTRVYDLVVGDRVAKEAVTEFTGEGKYKELAGLLKLKFPSADAWFEEDERIYGHPKDPYKVCLSSFEPRRSPPGKRGLILREQRIDVLQTSRHVRIEVNGVEVANTRRAYFLFETGLRMRTYIPVMDARLDLLTPSDTVSLCPYKVRVPVSIDMANMTDTVSGVGKLF